MNKKIGILGCGWLGFPLAKSFASIGYQVRGSTTSVDKILSLALHDINPFLIAIHNHHTEGNLDYFLKDLDLLIINLPPKLQSNPNTNYVSKVHTLAKKISDSNTRNIIFISSTSVYGNSRPMVDENSLTAPQTESGKQILETEKLLMNCENLSIKIIRCAGLYGPSRHPVFQLAQKEKLRYPDHPVNLIHLEDCIGIIHHVINNDIDSQIINAVAPFHPNRESYYSNIAKKLDLKLPPFNPEESSFGKTVNSIYINTKLGYKFKYPELEL